MTFVYGNSPICQRLVKQSQRNTTCTNWRLSFFLLIIIASSKHQTSLSICKPTCFDLSSLLPPRHLVSRCWPNSHFRWEVVANVFLVKNGRSATCFHKEYHSSRQKMLIEVTYLTVTLNTLSEGKKMNRKSVPHVSTDARRRRPVDYHTSIFLVIHCSLVSLNIRSIRRDLSSRTPQPQVQYPVGNSTYNSTITCVLARKECNS